MGFPVDKTRLCFFREYYQMAVFRTDLNDIEKAYVLRCYNQQTQQYKQQYYKIWIDPMNMLNIKDVAVPPVAGYIQRNYRFNSIDYGDVLLGDAGIIIGTGDIRHVNIASRLDNFDLMTGEQDALIITCPAPYKITIYSRTEPQNTLVYDTVLDSNPCAWVV